MSDGTASGPAAGQVPPLRALQALWASFLGVVAFAAIVVPLVAPDRTSTVPAVLPAALTLAAGLGALAGTVAIDRTFAATPPPDDATAVAELRTRLVLQLAIAEAPALLGVALGFALGPSWAATIGAAPALVALLLVRPRPARVARFDAAWRAAGADVSLDRGLRTAPR